MNHFSKYQKQAMAFMRPAGDMLYDLCDATLEKIGPTRPVNYCAMVVLIAIADDAAIGTTCHYPANLFPNDVAKILRNTADTLDAMAGNPGGVQ